MRAISDFARARPRFCPVRVRFFVNLFENSRAGFVDGPQPVLPKREIMGESESIALCRGDSSSQPVDLPLFVAAKSSSCSGSELLKGLAAHEVQRLFRAGRRRTAVRGEAICRQGDEGQCIFLILDGRAQVTIEIPGQGETVVNQLGPGDHFGELTMLVGGRRTATVTALTNSQLLEVQGADFEQLVPAIPTLAANLCHSLGKWVRRAISGKRSRPRPAQVALIHGAPRTAGLAVELIAALGTQGAHGQLWTVRPEQWPPITGWRVHALPTGSIDAERRTALQREWHGAAADQAHVILDLDRATTPVALLSSCDQVWVLAEAEQPSAVELLTPYFQAHPELAERSFLIWLVHAGARLSAPVPQQLTDPKRERRVARARGKPELTRPADLQRLAHQLRGIQVGLVLSGGAARGAAHIGVLRRFEREGIYFDQIAGTSIGAVVGAHHAAGYNPEEILDGFMRVLSAPRWLRRFPGGKRWHMLASYRLGLMEGKLRRTLTDWHFSQLLVPLHTISVDLVSGQEQVRDSGEIVPAVLESTNLPCFSRPILRNGQALVDGAILNNLPVGVLRDRGADLVVAVNLESILSKEIGGNTSQTPTSAMRPLSVPQTLMRILEVQWQSLTHRRGAGAEVMINPNLSEFHSEDFDRAVEMAAVGEAAADECIPELKQKLHALRSSSI